MATAFSRFIYRSAKKYAKGPKFIEKIKSDSIIKKTGVKT